MKYPAMVLVICLGYPAPVVQAASCGDACATTTGCLCPPYAYSDDLRVAWDADVYVALADGGGREGADNFPMTWVDDGTIDGQQITVFGDGHGFHIGVNDCGLGVARVTSGPADLNGVDLLCEPRGRRGGKTHGIFSLLEGGSLYFYMFVGPNSGWTGATETWLRWSEDGGQTWPDTQEHHNDIWWTAAQGIHLPVFLNAGKGYADAPDEYVYLYAGDVSNGVDGPYSGINMMRVLNNHAHIIDRSKYSYFTGYLTDGRSCWSPDVADARPVFTDPNGAKEVTVTYHPALQRYLLTVPHVNRDTPQSDGSAGYGSVGIFDAPSPWGPWTTVYYDDSFLGSSTLFLASISSKWLQPDGTFSLIFTGFGNIAKDAYNHIYGQFVSPAGGSAVTTLPLNPDFPGGLSVCPTTGGDTIAPAAPTNFVVQ